MGLAIGIGLLAIIIVVYVVSYAVNEKTSVPPGCEDLKDLSSCGACTNGDCSIKKTIKVEDKHVK